MAAGKNSQKVQLCLLLADGELHWADKEAGAYGSAPLILSRELCRFHHFAALAGTTRARTEAAAQLYSESDPPFETTDSLRLRTASGVAIWWWDRARVEKLLAGRRPYSADQCLPESLIHPIPEGWRLLALHAGYEAQYWLAGALVASSWRRHLFDRNDWQAFLDLAPSAVTPGPDEPPLPQAFPLSFANYSIPKRVPRGWGMPQAEQAAFAVAVLLAAFGSYSFGRAWQLDDVRAANLELASKLDAPGNSEREDTALSTNLAAIRGFQELVARRAPLKSMADVFGMMRELELEPNEWKVDDAGLELHIVPAPDLALVRDLAQLIEEHPMFAAASAEAMGKDEGQLVQAAVEQPRGLAGSAP